MKTILALLMLPLVALAGWQWTNDQQQVQWSPARPIGGYIAGSLHESATPPVNRIDRSTHPAHATLYAREWQLIALLYRYSTPDTAGVDPTGDAAANYDKLVTYAAGIADISTRMGVMADADRMQFLWVWCERERSKLGVTVGYGERYIGQ